jgi:hypothetical protein
MKHSMLDDYELTIDDTIDPFDAVNTAADHEADAILMNDEVTLDMSFFDLADDIEPRNVVATIAYEDLEVAA